MLPINSTAHQLERVTVRCLTLLLKLYSNHTVFMLDDYKGQKVNDISKNALLPVKFSRKRHLFCAK